VDEQATPQVPSGPAVVGIAPAPQPVDDGRVNFDEFMRIDIRAGRILAAERVPKSKKLLKLEVDLGTERRVVVAGLAEAYEPEALVGRFVPIVANLKPATLMGIQSNGMILAASVPGGLPIVLGFEKEPVPGSRIK
jgi:methionyl-tRNA synthetase